MKVYEINNKDNFSFSAIYLWTNLVNNKVYVGQTQNFYDRMKQYQRGNDSERVIGKALSKYGFDNFDISVLEKDIPLNKLDEREQCWMDYYHSYDNNIGYNVCKEAGTTRGFRHSEESKKKMSQKQKEYYEQHPEKIRRGEDNPMFGKKASDETRAKISRSLIGNQHVKGKHWNLSEETKEKHRQNMLGKQNCLGRKLSDETKQKIADSNRRRVYSQETKDKISKSQKELWKTEEYRSKYYDSWEKKSKKVLCVETNIIYDSLHEAMRSTNIDRSSISKCCKGKVMSAGGLHWQFV